jgi:hypothetical protein
MEHRVKVDVTSAAIVVALGVAASLITSTAIAGRAYQQRAAQAQTQSREIDVRGSARVRVTSDLAVWRIHVSGRAASLQEAFRNLDKAAGQVRAFLVDAGFPADTVTLNAIDTTEYHKKDKHDNDTPEVEAYTLSQTFTVTTSDVGKIDRTASRVTELIGEGVPVVSWRPEYYFSKAADLKIKVIADATADAKARAEQIARSAGCALAEVRRVNVGPLQITQPDSTDISSGGRYDTATIEKDVSVVVNAEFGLG